MKAAILALAVSMMTFCHVQPAPANGTLPNYKQLVIDAAGNSFVMPCADWAGLVKSAHHLGAERFLVVMNAYSNQLPRPRAIYLMAFSRLAAAYLTDHPDWSSGPQAFTSAIVDCGATI